MPLVRSTSETDKIAAGVGAVEGEEAVCGTWGTSCPGTVMGEVVLAAIGIVCETTEAEVNWMSATRASWFGMDSDGRTFAATFI